jgi:LuxR family maltose regulon positive regulatory protein
LRAELSRRRLSARYELHRVAADWFSTAGNPLQALAHAIAARDDELVTRLVANHGLAQILIGRAAGLKKLLDKVPQRVLARHPVALVAAQTGLALGDVPAADRLLQRTSAARPPLRDHRTRALAATVGLHRAMLHGDIGAALAKLRTTRAGHTGYRDLDLLALVNRGVAAIWTGDRQAGGADLRRALEQATTDHRDAVSLHCQVHLAAEGDLTQLSEHAEAALEFARSRHWSTTSRCAYLYTLLGVVAHQRLDDLATQQFCALAMGPGPMDQAVQLFAGTLQELVTADDDPESVAMTLRRQWRLVNDRNLSPILFAYLAPALQRMALRIGDRAWAMELLQRADAVLHPCGERALLRATMHVHTGKAGVGRSLLLPILGGQNRTIVTPTLIDAWLLEAHLAQRAADLQRAHDSLRQALALAAPHRALRPFHDSDPAIRELLASGTGRFGKLEPFAAKVLTTIPPPMQDLACALTKREQALLTELPSMRTAEEIAGSLFVSVNTVKTHLRGIYRKLGVRRRRDAITVARQRGLL